MTTLPLQYGLVVSCSQGGDSCFTVFQVFHILASRVYLKLRMKWRRFDGSGAKSHLYSAWWCIKTGVMIINIYIATLFREILLFLRTLIRSSSLHFYGRDACKKHTTSSIYIVIWPGDQSKLAVYPLSAQYWMNVSYKQIYSNSFLFLCMGSVYFHEACSAQNLKGYKGCVAMCTGTALAYKTASQELFDILTVLEAGDFKQNIKISFFSCVFIILIYHALYLSWW